jgi:hypothetical protein
MASSFLFHRLAAGIFAMDSVGRPVRVLAGRVLCGRFQFRPIQYSTTVQGEVISIICFSELQRY